MRRAPVAIAMVVVAFVATVLIPAPIGAEPGSSGLERVDAIAFPGEHGEFSSAAVHPDGTSAYVGKRQPGGVVRVDLATHETASVGGFSPPMAVETGAVAIDPAGAFLYAGSLAEGTFGAVISKVDLASDTVVDTLHLEEDVHDGIFAGFVAPSGAAAYFLARTGWGSGPWSVLEVDLETFTLSATLTSADLRFSRVAVSSDGSTAHIGGIVVDLDSFTQVGVTPLTEPFLVHPGGDALYASTATSILRLHPDTGTVEASIAVPAAPTGVVAVGGAVMDPAGAFALFSYRTAGVPDGPTPDIVVKVDLATFAVVDVVELAADDHFDLVEEWTREAIITPDGAHAYFATVRGADEFVVQVATGAGLAPEHLLLTGRFTTQQCAVFDTIVANDEWFADPADIVAGGVALLQMIAEAGDASAFDPVPANDGPCAVTAAWPMAERDALLDAAAAWGVDPDALHNLGGRLVLVIIYVLAVSGG